MPDRPKFALMQIVRVIVPDGEVYAGCVLDVAHDIQAGFWRYRIEGVPEYLPDAPGGYVPEHEIEAYS